MYVNMIPAVVLLTVVYSVAARETDNEEISIADLRNQIKDLKETQQILIDTLTDQKKKLEYLEGISPSKTDTVRHRRAVRNETVVFSVVLTGTGVTASNTQPIPFNHVYSDTINGFDSANGVYTVTRPGLYQLYTSVAVNGHDSIHAHLLKNSLSNPLCTCSAVDYSTGSCMVIVPLTEGDKVWVTDVFGHHVRGAWMTTFNGVCLDCE